MSDFYDKFMACTTVTPPRPTQEDVRKAIRNTFKEAMVSEWARNGKQLFLAASVLSVWNSSHLNPTAWLTTDQITTIDRLRDDLWGRYVALEVHNPIKDRMQSVWSTLADSNPFPRS